MRVSPYSSSSPFHQEFRGTATPPASTTAISVTQYSGLFFIAIATRSPGMIKNLALIADATA
jgi:hypothetical protein